MSSEWPPLLERDQPWYEQRQLLLRDRARKPLRELSARLGDADWLEGEFSAGDLMLVGVLFRAQETGILDEFPNICAYVARGNRAARFPSGLLLLNWRYSRPPRAAEGDALA